ncbi:MAG TPA: RHS repeat-associated core domain-containing protein [Polyangiaceae bacterium]|nr:RHS repeat-associated core domain-containing protein [Polyangiaceae bacterium]
MAGRLNDIVTPSGAYHRDYYGLIPCVGCAAGRLSRLTSPDAVTLDYQYDGQLLTKSTWSGAVNGAVAFAYNADFRVKTETVTTTSGSAAYQFGFDADTLLTCASPTNCTTPGADAFTLAYGGSGTHGLPTGSTLGNVTEALTYNTVGELATQTGEVGATTVFAETYDSGTVPRDALGRIKRKVELVNGSTANWDYTYDLAGRLENVQLNGSAYETYTYDANGNRLSVVKPSATTTATYDDQDRLLTNGPWTYTYTPNGELLTKSNSSTGANWAYLYDVFGNLKRVDLPSGDVIEYLVDGQNRRVGKKKNGVLQKQWLYEDQLHPVAELDGSGALVARFVFAAKKNAPDLVIAGGVTYRVFTDQLGSPRALVNATSGAVTGVMRHDAWGVMLEDSVSALMPFGFAGGLYDAETGLVRFGARDYDPQVGRWVSKDPIRFDGGQANFYSYVSNDSVNRSDATGLDSTATPQDNHSDECKGCIAKCEKAPGDCPRVSVPPSCGEPEPLETCKEREDRIFARCFHDKCEQGPCRSL